VILLTVVGLFAGVRRSRADVRILLETSTEPVGLHGHSVVAFSCAALLQLGRPMAGKREQIACTATLAQPCAAISVSDYALAQSRRDIVAVSARAPR